MLLISGLPHTGVHYPHTLILVLLSICLMVSSILSLNLLSLVFSILLFSVL